MSAAVLQFRVFSSDLINQIYANRPRGVLSGVRVQIWLMWFFGRMLYPILRFLVFDLFVIAEFFHDVSSIFAVPGVQGSALASTFRRMSQPVCLF